MKAIVIAALLAALPTVAGAQEGDFYAGVLLGAGHGEREAIGSGWTAETNGTLIGGMVGYTVMTSPILLGIEADYQLSNIGSDRTWGRIDGLDHFGTVRALAGFQIEDFSIYGTAGVAFGSGYFHPRGAPRKDEFIVGTAIGIGAKYQVTEALGLTADVLQLNFGEPKYFSMLLGNAAVRTEDRVARVGVVFSF
ncbi:MAG TPA: outer membrane beta-barrel protein [Pelagibacterium sp.]|uniref:outer membrane protein n=1 Tax=Pelagibacterium sp. TaxID=1967288 RepID=UPI002BD5BFEB|nr:outer membrane beta-barrel protein [Pelagibacterium sp.]HWJ89110.1 outer membrane beta-barrel protein [Pelagibacterium sp.]